MKLTNAHTDMSRYELLSLADRALHFINANWPNAEGDE